MLIVNSLNPDRVTMSLEDTMTAQLLRMYAKGAELRGDSPTEYETVLKLANRSEMLCRNAGKIPMRWNAVAPVITRAPAKTGLRKDEIDHVCRHLTDDAFGVEARRIILELARAAGVE